MNKRPRKQVPTVKLARSFVGKDKEYFDGIFVKDKNKETTIEEHTSVTSRTAATTNVYVPNGVSDDPREVALKGGTSC